MVAGEEMGEVEDREKSLSGRGWLCWAWLGCLAVWSRPRYTPQRDPTTSRTAFNPPLPVSCSRSPILPPPAVTFTCRRVRFNKTKPCREALPNSQPMLEFRGFLMLFIGMREKMGENCELFCCRGDYGGSSDGGGVADCDCWLGKGERKWMEILRLLKLLGRQLVA